MSVFMSKRDMSTGSVVGVPAVVATVGVSAAGPREPMDPPFLLFRSLS